MLLIEGIYFYWPRFKADFHETNCSANSPRTRGENFAAAMFFTTKIYSANVFSLLSTLKRILAPLSPEQSCNILTESKIHVHCFLHPDGFKTTCETFRLEKVEFVSSFSSAHCERKLLKLRMLSSVSRRIR